MKHTPGPWKAGWYNDARYCVYSGQIVVAEVQSTVGEFLQEKANAQLIAAAPALLRTCKLLVDRLNIIVGATQRLNQAHKNVIVDELKEALQEIRKAERGK
jgi:hypothetical protein